MEEAEFKARSFCLKLLFYDIMQHSFVNVLFYVAIMICSMLLVSAYNISIANTKH